MPLSQPPGVAEGTFNDHSARHENAGADEIDATGLTGAGGGGGGGWEEVSTTGTKLEAGRNAIYDSAEQGRIILEAGVVSLESIGDEVGLYPDNGQVVNIGSGDGLLLPELAADPTAVRDGHTYYNTATDLVRVRANGAWADLGSGGGAPTTADYLVATAQGGLSAEIVVGATPGGELGGTWGTPTVDATHSGSTHSAATDTHIADATDAHDASAVSFDDTGLTITAADVQTMGEQLDAAISAGGIPATIFDAEGDIIVASAADTAARLAKGAAGTVLTAGASTVAYGFPPGYEIDYAEITSPASITATAEASADTVVSGNAVAYDGSTIVLIEFWTPFCNPDVTAAGNYIACYLYDGAGSIGRIDLRFNQVAGVNNHTPISGQRRLTPSNASHTYSIRAIVNTGTGSIGAGAGGSGNDVPAFLRITKA